MKRMSTRNSFEKEAKGNSKNGLLRINFTLIFKFFIKLLELRSDKDNLENFENTSEINP